jgi:hypothetical protein
MAQAAAGRVAVTSARPTPACRALAVDLRRWTLTWRVVVVADDGGAQHPHPHLRRQCSWPDQDDAAGVVVAAPAALLRQWRWAPLQPPALAVAVLAAAAGHTPVYVPGAAADDDDDYNDPDNAAQPLFATAHAREKTARLQAQRVRTLWRELGIKRVDTETADVVSGKNVSMAAATAWHGCTRHGARCFGSIVDDTPAYLAGGRWTPPCCLAHLRATAAHVFQQLAACGVRFWLEGGTLLGALRPGADIIPWDYDVDVGIFRDDIAQCAPLAAAASAAGGAGGGAGGGVADAAGFVWERAAEGGFFRVQYSAANRVHVDLWPFWDDGHGTMTKDTWMPSHPQDRPFPRAFLEPLEFRPFAGVDRVPVPNHAREFLELKFGRGVVEHPRYPDSTLADE